MSTLKRDDDRLFEWDLAFQFGFRDSASLKARFTATEWDELRAYLKLTGH